MVYYHTLTCFADERQALPVFFLQCKSKLLQMSISVNQEPRGAQHMVATPEYPLRFPVGLILTHWGTDSKLNDNTRSGMHIRPSGQRLEKFTARVDYSVMGGKYCQLRRSASYVFHPHVLV